MNKQNKSVYNRDDIINSVQIMDGSLFKTITRLMIQNKKKTKKKIS